LFELTGTFQQRNNNGSTRQRWSKYQTALSNTGPLGEATTGGGESDTDSGMPLVSRDSATGIIMSSTIMSTPTSEMNSSSSNHNNISSQSPSYVGGRNLSETGNSLVTITSPVSTTVASTRHQHQQQTRSVTSSRGVNNSGSLSTYNNNRNNNNNGKMLSGGISSSGAGGNAPSSSAARKRIYEDLGHKFTDGALFENNTSVNITVPLGDTAFLRCRVRNLGERSVSAFIFVFCCMRKEGRSGNEEKAHVCSHKESHKVVSHW